MFAHGSTILSGISSTTGMPEHRPVWVSAYRGVLDDIPDIPGTEYVTTDVFLYAIAILVAVALTLFIYRTVKRYLKDPGQVLQETLSDYDGVTVLMHPNPDPDAMASAIGVAKIADTVDTDAQIQYTGQIRHQENRAFRTVLDMDCERIENASEIAYENAIVLVDHNTPRGFTEAEKIEPVAVIDHHPGNGTGTEFTDVRDDYGATASIITEYLTEIDAVLEQTLDDENEEEPDVTVDTELATGLTYGIQSDTKHLTRGCIQPDFGACSTLFPGIDEDMLNRIANPQVSHDVLKVKARAITDIMIDGSFGVCNVGEVENVDAVSQAVDELMRLEGVTAVVVYAKNNGTLHMSGRSRDDRVHMGECLQQAVSDIDMASAGGHARMGGGQIPINHLSEFGSSDGVSFEEFNDRLFNAMNGDH